jgi:hypothetical protein
MKKTFSLRLGIGVLVALCLQWNYSLAEINGYDIKKQEPWAGGKKFGLAGNYERIEGQIRFTADPRAVNNRLLPIMRKRIYLDTCRL